MATNFNSRTGTDTRARSTSHSWSGAVIVAFQQAKLKRQTLTEARLILGTISHHLRNPVFVIMGLVKELLIKDHTKAMRKKLLNCEYGCDALYTDVDRLDR